MKLLSPHIRRIAILLCCIIVVIGLLILSIYLYEKEQYANQSALTQNQKLVTALEEKEKNITSLKAQIGSVNASYTSLENTTNGTEITSLQLQVSVINNAFAAYNQVQKDIASANSLGLSVQAYTTAQQSALNQLLAQSYTAALAADNSLHTTITNAINQKKASLVTPTPKPSTAAPPVTTSLAGSSYHSTTINAQGKNYTVDYIAIDLTYPGLSIKTDTANGSDCGNNCPVSDLMSYYNNDHGFAAINGTYFCPTSYASCAGKTNTFDFPVYNSNLHKWINQGNISWINRSMLTFNGASPTFYPDASKYAGASITAGFTMAPGLISNGQIIVNNFPIDAKSATEVTTRGAMGIAGNTLYIADIMDATVPNTAYVMQKLGATDAIELDGGGSVAMIYDGRYMLGPGRAIPNAIVFSN